MITKITANLTVYDTVHSTFMYVDFDWYTIWKLIHQYLVFRDRIYKIEKIKLIVKTN